MKSYLQFRRALRRYYANDPVETKRMLGRSMSHYWRQQYGLWQDGVRNTLISDATCVAMALMPAKTVPPVYYVVNTSNPERWLWSIPYDTIRAVIERLEYERKCARDWNWSEADVNNCLGVYMTRREDLTGWQPRGEPVGIWIKNL